MEIQLITIYAHASTGINDCLQTQCEPRCDIKCCPIVTTLQAYYSQLLMTSVAYNPFFQCISTLSYFVTYYNGNT